jgi:hypothetical protein
MGWVGLARAVLFLGTIAFLCGGPALLLAFRAAATQTDGFHGRVCVNKERYNHSSPAATMLSCDSLFLWRFLETSVLIPEREPTCLE